MRMLLGTLMLVIAGCGTHAVTVEGGRAVTAKPAAQPAQWIEVAPQTYLRYQRTGNGQQPVVLLHSLGTAFENWDEVAPALASKERTVLRFDQRGAGLSTKIREPVTMDVWVEDLRVLLDELDLSEPAVLIGDTFGATIALQFAATYPDRAAGVVALGPTAFLVQNPKQFAKFPDPLAPGAAPASLGDREREFNTVYPPVLRTDEHRSARFFGVAYSADPTSAVLTMRAVYSVGFKDVFARVRCPVIVAAGRLFVQPVAAVRELSDAIPHSRLVELETGHYAGVQSPELVTPLVQNFLQELGR